MLRMVLLLELPLDMPAPSSRNFADFRSHNSQTSFLSAFALLFCATPFLGSGLSPRKARLHTPHLRLAPSGVQQNETPQQQLRCMRTGIFGGVQCLQKCICVRAVRLSRFVELSQLSGGFPTEPSSRLRHIVASRVAVHFQDVVLSLSCPCCQRCNVAEQLSRSVAQICIKAAPHFSVAWKLCRPLSSGRLFLR